MGIRRLHYLSYIINLAVKAFILSSDVKAFKDKVAITIEGDERLGISKINLVREQEKWRL